MKIKLCCLFFFFAIRSGFSQSIVVNTPDSIFYLNQGTLCGFAWANTYCGQGSTGVFSTAIHKDTLYVLTTNSSLYKMKLGAPATCTFLTTFASNDPFGNRATVNSMTTDKNGIIYAADAATTEILRYNPYTNIKEFLGRIGTSPGGDMMFYKNKLLLATAVNGIYEVNISNPALSVQYMPTDGHNFYGLVSVPFDCMINKYYGLKVVFGDTTQLIELDLENKLIGGVACKVPKVVYDAASNVDDGNTIGVTIDSIHVQAACGNETLANIRVMAHSATTGLLTYVLDGAVTNNTGIFNGLSEGPHTLNISNSLNCTKDSAITIFHGLTLTAINAVNPVSCDQENGSIGITASSGYLPITYKIDQGNFQSASVFNNLGAGVHTVTIRDAGGCEKDTIIYLRYQLAPSYFSAISVQPTICNSKSGSIVIHLPAGTDPANVSAALDNGTPQPVLSFPNLDAGTYNLSLFFQNRCRYDTLIQIDRLNNERPAIDLNITDQQCLLNNGSVAISVNGSNNPYLINFNNTSYSANTLYSELSGGTYPVSIQDKNTCLFDTIAEVKPYIVPAYSILTEKTDPPCIAPNTGEITINVSGGQSPYSFKINDNIYPNGTTVGNLVKGTYQVSLFNNEHCEIDTVNITLNIELTPECDFLFVPNAFTPNDDGLNDILTPYLGEGITGFQFSVYNRWGQLLFTTTTRSKGWDGRLAGKSQASGVYIWAISYTTANNPVKRLIKGTLTLIR